MEFFSLVRSRTPSSLGDALNVKMRSLNCSLKRSFSSKIEERFELRPQDIAFHFITTVFVMTTGILSIAIDSAKLLWRWLGVGDFHRFIA